jgi:hypothetical protein
MKKGELIKNMIAIKKEIEKTYKKHPDKNLGDAIVSIDLAIQSLNLIEEKKIE